MCGYFGTKKKSLCVGILEPKKIVLLNYPLGLSLLKYRNVWVFWFCLYLNIGMCGYFGTKKK